MSSWVFFLRTILIAFLLKQALSTNWDDNSLDDSVKINIRLHNHPETMIALKNLKSAYIGKFMIENQIAVLCSLFIFIIIPGYMNGF